MRGFAQHLDPARLERLERLECLHELALASRRLAPLQLLVLIGALAHAVAAQLRECAPRDGHRFGGGPGVRKRERFQLVDEAEVQVAPFPHRLALPVTLLPAVHPVARRTFALALGGLGPIVTVAGAEHLLEGIQHLGNVVDELRAGQGRGGRELRVRIGRLPPALQQRLAARGEVRGDRVELVPGAFPRCHARSRSW